MNPWTCPNNLILTGIVFNDVVASTHAYILNYNPITGTWRHHDAVLPHPTYAVETFIKGIPFFRECQIRTDSDRVLEYVHTVPVLQVGDEYSRSELLALKFG